MSRFKALTRITMVQVSLGVTAVTLCLLMGLIPDHRISRIEGRERLCEALALNGAVMVHQRDVARLQAVLDVIVERHEDLLSAGIRRHNKKIVVQSGEHAQNWPADHEVSTDAFMSIPILQKDNSTWGQLELRFEPVMTQGLLMGFLSHPWTRYSALFATICFPLFYWNLRKVLRQLDPSKAVPRNVSEAYDFLAGAMVGLNTQQRIVISNVAFTEIVGLDRNELVGKKIDELPWIFDDNDATEYPWNAVSKERTHAYGVSLKFNSPTQGDRILMVNAAALVGQAGNHSGTLVNFEDITPLEKTKAALEKSKEEAEAANEAKSAFLANMSHEIRTPMNAILGFADIMRRGLDETLVERDEYLGIIHSSGEHLLALINDILDLSKVESGSMQIEVIECRPHVIANDTLNTFAVKAKERDLTLSFHAKNSVPETIQTDPLRLRQVLTNLVGNAMKFTEHGEVRIEFEMLNETGEPKMAFHIVDSGIGIEPDKIAKIFQPFSQADSSTTRKYGGTGLGLSISRRLAELMGGELTATSEVGKGSVFSFSISVGDLADVNFISQAEIEKELSAVNTKKSGKKQLPPGHILAVDDGEANRRLVRLVMERAGATVVEAVDGQEAVDKATAESFDVILMDVQMPRKDGKTAAKEMRSLGITVPIVALTAHALDDEKEQIMQAGYSHFIAKPINIDDLLELTAELLGGELIPSEDAEAVAKTDQDLLTAGELDEADTTTWPHEEDDPFLDLVSSADDKDSTNSKGSRPNANTRQIDEFDEIEYLDFEIDEPQTSPPVHQSLEKPTSASVSLPQSLPNTKPKDAIESDLPTDDEDFRAIVEEFVNRLLKRLSEMAALWCEKDYAALAKQAHWLKGAGGTAGFQLLTELGTQLEKAAKQSNDDKCEQMLDELVQVARRLWVHKAATEQSDQVLSTTYLPPHQVTRDAN